MDGQGVLHLAIINDHTSIAMALLNYQGDPGVNQVNKVGTVSLYLCTLHAYLSAM